MPGELLWLFDMDLFGAETQTDADDLIQDCLHVIEQDKGSNLDDLTRGVGVSSSLSKPATSGIEAVTAAMLTRDERVQRVDAKLLQDDQGGFTLNVSIYSNDDILNLPPVPVVGNTSGGK